MKSVRAFLMIVIVCLNSGVLSGHALPAEWSADSSSERAIDFTRVDDALLNATLEEELNRFRLQNGQKPLQPARELRQAAALHSRDMVQRDFFDHTNPYEETKRTLSLRLARQQCQASAIAENIALAFGIRYRSGEPLRSDDHKTYVDARSGKKIPPHSYRSLARQIAEDWMNSPSHRQNMLQSRFGRVGCGAAFFRNPSFNNMPMFKATCDFAS